jgi:hypothetical protein
MNSASLCSLAGRYENAIPPQCLAPIDFLKIPALVVLGRSYRISEKRYILVDCTPATSNVYIKQNYSVVIILIFNLFLCRHADIRNRQGNEKKKITLMRLSHLRFYVSAVISFVQFWFINLLYFMVCLIYIQMYL